MKAANVLLVKEKGGGSDPIARLADFGLSKVVLLLSLGVVLILFQIKEVTHHRPTRSLSLLDLSAPCGTRAWMAPGYTDFEKVTNFV